jgi:hypothetical protein
MNLYITRGHVFAKTRIKNPCEVSKHDCGPVAALYFSARFLPFYGKPRSFGKFLCQHLNADILPGLENNSDFTSFG